MGRITQLPVVFILLLSIACISCNNYGKKINIKGTKGEVYFKDGGTEDEAQKTGDFLKEEGFLNNNKDASVQVTKEKGVHTVRFVYDKEYYDKNNGILDNDFKQYALKFSEEIFNGEEVNIVLADEQFKDFKTILFDKATVKKQDREGPPGEPIDKNEYDHDSQGGINFYWKGISDQESKFIADYIVKSGEFAGGVAEIYMLKEGDRYILKFPVRSEYRNDQTYITEVERVARLIKDNVFPNNSYSFQMTDEKLNAVKSFDY